MGYTPSDNCYSGDDKFRKSARKHKKRRISGEDESRDNSFPDTGVTMDNLRVARQNGWFCDTIDEIHAHFGVIVNTNNACLCEVCGWTVWEVHVCNPGKEVAWCTLCFSLP